MTRKELKLEVSEVIEKQQTVNKAVDWWGNEMNLTIAAIEKLEVAPWKKGCEKKMEALINKLNNLVAKGEFELRSLDVFEKEVKNLEKERRKIEKREKKGKK